MQALTRTALSSAPKPAASTLKLRKQGILSSAKSEGVAGFFSGLSSMFKFDCFAKRKRSSIVSSTH